MLLALIYLFFGRVLWAVWSEVRTPVMPAARVGGGTASRGRAKKTSGKGVPMFVVIEPKQHRGATYTLSSVLAIGRLEDNDIVIDDDSFISSHHARIEIRPEGSWVVDLGSTNGCFVNGQRVADQRSVRKGDRIQVGSTVLEMRS
jgi:pSer/pThr/pTyr-binding forkhead associated (FHA) protein